MVNFFFVSIFLSKKNAGIEKKKTKVALQGTISTGTNRDVTKSFGEVKSCGKYHAFSEIKRIRSAFEKELCEHP